MECMITTRRTTSDDADFRQLVKGLDRELARRNKETNDFYAQYNRIDVIPFVVVAYDNDMPVGCGAMKAFDTGVIEFKRMYVPPPHRGKGIASRVLTELQLWATECGYVSCVLETGIHMTEAIALYTKHGFNVIPNYGQYAGVSTSVCFEKRW